MGLTGRRGDVDGLVNVRRLSWSTLVAGSDPEQILLPFNHVRNSELLVLDPCSHLRHITLDCQPIHEDDMNRI